MDHQQRRKPSRPRRIAIVASTCAVLLAAGIAVALPASAARPMCGVNSGGITCVKWTYEPDNSFPFTLSVTDDPDGRETHGQLFMFANGTQIDFASVVVLDGHGSDRKTRHAPAGTTHMQLKICSFKQDSPAPEECAEGQVFPVA